METDQRGRAAPPTGALRPAVAAGLVFFTSGAVLVLEILAVRLLAPYIGMTLETYTTVIGVVLAGIALGTWLGGRAADRHEPRALLAPLLIGGGGLALLAVPLVTYLGRELRGGGAPEIVFLAMAALFAPAAALSAVAPTVVKLQLRDLRATGSVVGRLSAVGTAGAIAGTFATGFVLLAAFSMRAIVLGLGVSLIVIGVLCWALVARRRRSVATAAGLLVALAGLGASVAVPPGCDIESAYYCVEIEPDPARAGGYSLYLDGLRHSYLDIDDPAHLELGYTRIFAAVVEGASPRPEQIDVLHVGGGGLAMPRYLAATRPDSYSRVLELDPRLVEIVERELGVETGPRLEVRTGDARMTLAAEPTDAYDVVIGDAFSGLAVPWHLATVEFAADVRRVLRPDGVYVLNLIDHPPLAFARAELATLRDVFGDVAVIANPGPVHALGGGNVVLVASAAPLPIDGLAAEVGRWAPGRVLMSDPVAIDELVAGAPVLRDDYAPVDQLMSRPR